MIRNLKVLGLGLIVVFAFGATAASSASAIDTFTSTKNPETISGTSVDKGEFEITSVDTLRCHTGEFHAATVANKGSTATVTAAYKGTVGPPSTDTGHCGSAHFGKAEVNMHGCDYSLSGSTTGFDGSADATVSVLCNVAGEEITIGLPEFGVTLKIPAQTPTSGGATYTNNGGKVKVKVTATGVTYTCEPAFVCGLGGLSTEGNNADYRDEVEMSGAGGAISVSSS